MKNARSLKRETIWRIEPFLGLQAFGVEATEACKFVLDGAPPPAEGDAQCNKEKGARAKRVLNPLNS